MRIYTVSKAAQYLDKSGPTIARWIEQKRMKPDMYTPSRYSEKGKPMFLESTLQAIREEIEKHGMPLEKNFEDDEEPIPA